MKAPFPWFLFFPFSLGSCGQEVYGLAPRMLLGVSSRPPVSEVCTGGKVKERREVAVLLGGLKGLIKVPESFQDRRRFLTLGSDVVCISV